MAAMALATTGANRERKARVSYLLITNFKIKLIILINILYKNIKYMLTAWRRQGEEKEDFG